MFNIHLFKVKQQPGISTQQLKQVSTSNPRPQTLIQQSNGSLSQSGSQSLPQQILLRSTMSQVTSQAQQIQVQQGLPPPIQLRATMVSQQTPQIQQLRLSQPQPFQALQAQVQLPSGKAEHFHSMVCPSFN